MVTRIEYITKQKQHAPEFEMGQWTPDEAKKMQALANAMDIHMRFTKDEPYDHKGHTFRNNKWCYVENIDLSEYWHVYNLLTGRK